MTRRGPDVSPEQGQLFREVPFVGTVPVENYASQTTVQLLGTMYEQQALAGMPGPHVEIITRAGHLISALNNFGLRNQRLGFDTASNTRQYNGPIWERYRGLTPLVQDGAANNADIYLQRAKREFWKASGFAALREVKFAPREELDAGARKEWRDFAGKHETPDKRKARQQLARKLKKSIKITSQLELAT